MPNWKKVAVSGSNVNFNQITSSGDISSSANIISQHTTASGNISSSGTITANTFATTGTWTFDEYTSGTIGITTIQDSGTSFNDNDTSLLTAAAVDDRIGDYGYLAPSDAPTFTNAAGIKISDNTTSAATEGGQLTLIADDGAALGDGHRLGVIEFKGAEDGSNTLATGARIECVTENGAWSGANNAADLDFYVTAPNGTEIKALSIDGYDNRDATFAGDIICNEVRATQLTTTNFADPIGFHLDCDTSGVGAQDAMGMHIDFDRASPGSGTAAHNDIGINLDVTSVSLGTSTLTGMDIDVVGTTAGTSTAIGIDLDVDTADTNIGMIINTAGTHMKLVANADTDDYATFVVADTGDLTITTVGDGSTDSDLTLDADGQIKLEPAVGSNILLDGTITVDGGVIASATSITSAEFIGPLTGNVEGAVVGNASTATVGTSVTVTDNAETNETTYITFVDGASGTQGIETEGKLTYNPALNVLASSRKFTKTSTTDGNYDGDVVYFGGTTSMTIGTIYHYKSDGTWEAADADDNTKCDGLLAVALGAASDTNGMLLRGMVTLDHDPGAVGDVLFLSTTAGDCSSTAPSGDEEIIRVVGYCLDASNGQIWFDPDKTYVEVSA